MPSGTVGHRSSCNPLTLQPASNPVASLRGWKVVGQELLMDADVVLAMCTEYAEGIGLGADAEHKRGARGIPANCNADLARRLLDR